MPVNIKTKLGVKAMTTDNYESKLTKTNVLLFVPFRFCLL